MIEWKVEGVLTLGERWQSWLWRSWTGGTSGTSRLIPSRKLEGKTDILDSCLNHKVSVLAMFIEVKD